MYLPVCTYVLHFQKLITVKNSFLVLKMNLQSKAFICVLLVLHCNYRWLVGLYSIARVGNTMYILFFGLGK